jgi:hypothetical protein
MQAKNKTGTVTSSTSAVAGNVAQQKLQEEFDNMKARCELNEDLTGLSVLSHKQQDGSSVYNCVLQECNSNKTEGESCPPSRWIMAVLTHPCSAQLQADVPHRRLCLLRARHCRVAGRDAVEAPAARDEVVHEVSLASCR